MYFKINLHLIRIVLSNLYQFYCNFLAQDIYFPLYIIHFIYSSLIDQNHPK